MVAPLWQLSVSSQTHIVLPRSSVREARLNTHGQKFELFGALLVTAVVFYW